jgi:hypothetical protein
MYIYYYLHFNNIAVITQGIYLPLPNNETLFNTSLLTLPGNSQLDLGVTTLPLDLLCQQSGILGATVCHICNYDCTYVHNKYGGTCGTVDPSLAVPGTPQANGQVCICNDSPPTDGSNFTAISGVCGTIIDGDSIGNK